MEYATIGLDMSLAATGFCSKVGDKIEVETIKSTPKSAENDIARIQLIVSEVQKRIAEVNKRMLVGMICIEDYFVPSNKNQIGAAIKLVGLGMTTRIALYNSKAPFYVIAPGQLKKFATGNGSSPKSIVVREVFRHWDIECKDDNQADACVLAHMAEGILNGTDDLLKYQQDTIKKVISERPNYNLKQ